LGDRGSMAYIHHLRCLRTAYRLANVGSGGSGADEPGLHNRSLMLQTAPDDVKGFARDPQVKSALQFRKWSECGTFVHLLVGIVASICGRAGMPQWHAVPTALPIVHDWLTAYRSIPDAISMQRITAIDGRSNLQDSRSARGDDIVAISSDQTV